jgi:hypothetical protein
MPTRRLFAHSRAAADTEPSLNRLVFLAILQRARDEEADHEGGGQPNDDRDEHKRSDAHYGRIPSRLAVHSTTSPSLRDALADVWMLWLSLASFCAVA